MCLSHRGDWTWTCLCTKGRHCCKTEIMSIKEPNAESQNHLCWKKPLRSLGPTINQTLPGPTLLCIRLTSKSWEKFLKVGKFLPTLTLTSPPCTQEWMCRRRWYHHRQMQTGGKLLEIFLGSSLLRKEHFCTLALFKEFLQFLDVSLTGLWFPQLWEEGETLPLTLNPPVTQKKHWASSRMGDGIFKWPLWTGTSEQLLPKQIVMIPSPPINPFPFNFPWMSRGCSYPGTLKEQGGLEIQVLSAKMQQFFRSSGQELSGLESRLPSHNKSWFQQWVSWQSLGIIARNDGFKESKIKRARFI